MSLTKMVDGVSVECSPEEEAAILAEWAENDARPAPEPQPTIQDILDVLPQSIKDALKQKGKIK